VALLLSALVASAVGALLAFHILLIYAGETSIEHALNGTLRARCQRKKQVFKNPFDRGPVRNAEQVSRPYRQKSYLPCSYYHCISTPACLPDFLDAHFTCLFAYGSIGHFLYPFIHPSIHPSICSSRLFFLLSLLSSCTTAPRLALTNPLP
jgi:hypothetical protein